MGSDFYFGYVNREIGKEIFYFLDGAAGKFVVQNERTVCADGVVVPNGKDDGYGRGIVIDV